ncbi:MAG: hypothetical protein KAS18_00730 [Calditrichia bacterium]|nr:hypothetical protein [Calditrichia bacterium]
MKYLLVIFFLITSICGQVLKKDGFMLSPKSIEPGDSEIILGNGIIDLITIQDSIVLAGTGYGLNLTADDGETWHNFTSTHYKGKGGIAAIAIMDDSTIWISSAYDSLIIDDELPVGGGLSYTRDFGKTWVHVPQPVDPNISRDSLGYAPTTTNVQNLTYDIAILDSTIWITSWAGGLRKSDDMGQTWQVVTVDGQPFDVSAASNLNWKNHVAFSVLAENENLWVGTAAGIWKSSDGGNLWEQFNHNNSLYPISGNFIVAISHQNYIKSSGDTVNAIWAATIEATETSEVRAVSKTVNGGETWEILLENTFPHNFAFDDSVVYVTADEGLFISNDAGKNWYTLPPVRDEETGEEILTNVYYSATVSKRLTEKTLWVGSADGLASTKDNGNTWKIHRSFQSTRLKSTPDAYAYPSPFSPSRHDFIRFQYDITQAGEVKIDIYDFAMDKVIGFTEYESAPSGSKSDRSAKWNGRNNRSDIAASGVYFFRVKVEGKVTWGKIVIIN